MEKTQIKVQGMSCNHCKMAIEKTLDNLGVKAEVNLDDNSVFVEYDPKKVDVSKMEMEIEELGYDVIK